MNLTNLLRTFLRGDSSSPSTVVSLVNALNMCMPNSLSHFAIGRQQCAGDFLISMLDNLDIGQLFTTFAIEGTCTACNTGYSLMGRSASPFIFLLPVPSSGQGPLDLMDLG